MGVGSFKNQQKKCIFIQYNGKTHEVFIKYVWFSKFFNFIFFN